MYQLNTCTGEITRLLDGVKFAQDDSLPEFQAYSAWLALGNAPELVQEPVIEPRWITLDEFMARVTDEELSALATLAYQGEGDAIARMLLVKIQTRINPLDLNSPTLAQGLYYCATKGAWPMARVGEMLA